MPKWQSQVSAKGGKALGDGYNESIVSSPQLILLGQVSGSGPTIDPQTRMLGITWEGNLDTSSLQNLQVV